MTDCNCPAKDTRDTEGYPVGEWMHMSTCPVYREWMATMDRASVLIEKEAQDDTSK